LYHKEKGIIKYRIYAWCEIRFLSLRGMERSGMTKQSRPIAATLFSTRLPRSLRSLAMTMFYTRLFT